MAALSSREIILNVYDINDGSGRGGGFLRTVGMGTYHSGVEISGAEWTFSSGAGVFFHKPKTPAVGQGQSLTLKESIVLGVHQGSANEINGIINKLRDEFGPKDYHIIKKNCNHFSSRLCKELVGEDIPAWVNRPANVGSWFTTGLIGKWSEARKEKAANKEPKAKFEKGPAGKKKELTEAQKAALAGLKGGDAAGGGAAASTSI